MTVIEYINDPQDKPRSFHPKTIPSWITDGGYWWNPDGSEKMIAVVSDDNVPEGAKTYTLAELQARQRAIQASHPMLVDPLDKDSGDMTDDEVDAMIEEWWNARI